MLPVGTRLCCYTQVINLSLASRLSKICAPPLSLSHFINASLHICGAPHSTMDSILASHPAAPGLILGAPVPRFIEHCLVSGQWYSNKTSSTKQGSANPGGAYAKTTKLQYYKKTLHLTKFKYPNQNKKISVVNTFFLVTWKSRQFT